MKRVRKVYIAEGYGRIDSTDPRLTHGGGMTRVAMYFAEREARKQFGRNGVVLDFIQGEIHRLKDGELRRLPPRARMDTTGIWEFHCIIGRRTDAGTLDAKVITIPLRVIRARGHREYYEEPPFTPAKPEPPPFRKRG